MMLPSHLLATLLLGKLASERVRRFTPRDWWLAIGFGVVIDLDHLAQLPSYVALHGTAALSPAPMLAWGGAWQGVMHTPWALLLVVPFCLLYRSPTPAAFWLLHMVQDFVIAKHFVRWGGALEWAIVGALAAATAAVFWRARPRDVPFARHLAETLGLTRSRVPLAAIAPEPAASAPR